MRIDARSPIAPAGPTGVSRRGAASRFTLDGSEEARAAATAPSTAGLGGIEALLVLQGGEDHAQRRRRSAQRGRDILDALDGLKVALLAGRISAEQALRLRQLLSARREATDDPRLDEVLGQIELRAEVEIAKLARASAPR